MSTTTHLNHPKESGYQRQHKIAPYLFVSPFLVTFLVFGLYPIVKSLSLSLYATNGPKDHVYVGLSNYVFILHDPDFHTALWNTVQFALWSVFLQLPLALGLAILLNQAWLKGAGVLAVRVLLAASCRAGVCRGFVRGFVRPQVRVGQ